MVSLLLGKKRKNLCILNFKRHIDTNANYGKYEHWVFTDIKKLLIITILAYVFKKFF